MSYYTDTAKSLLSSRDLDSGHVETAQAYALIAIAEALEAKPNSLVLLNVGGTMTKQEMEELRDQLNRIFKETSHRPL